MSASFAVFCAVAFVTTEAFAAGSNVLINGDFEGTSANAAPTSYANNIPWVILPWVLGSGDQANVVTVKADGSYHYGTGPWRDASGAAGSGQRHYLDIAGKNDLYQPFTPPCNGEVEFGGFFSSRADGKGKAIAGTGSVRIVQGAGTGGTLVGTTNTVNLPAGGNANTDPWKPVSFSATLVAGQTYSFVVTMDNDVNFDEAFVGYKTECIPSPTPTPSPTARPSVSPAATPSATPIPTATTIPSPSVTPSATPVSTGCVQVAAKEIRCLPGGGYSYTFTATSNTGDDMSQILVSPVAGGTFSVSPQLFNLSPPLKNGQSTTQSATIGNVKPGEKVCFFVTLMSDKAACCTVQVCPTLPVCGVR